MGENEGEQERKSLGAAMAEEREERKCTVKGDNEDEGGDLWQGTDPSHRWMKRK